MHSKNQIRDFISNDDDIKRFHAMLTHYASTAAVTSEEDKVYFLKISFLSWPTSKNKNSARIVKENVCSLRQTKIFVFQ